MSSQSNPQRLVLVALLNRASTTHRLSILDQLVSATSPFELIAERSLRLTLPEDDELLRSLLAHEIETQGEAETLVRWALKFTATTNFFFVLRLKSAGPGEMSSKSASDVFVRDFAPALWEKYGENEIYVSPDQATADMQIELLFPESIDTAPAEPLAALQTESAPQTEAPSMMQTASSSSEASGGSGFSQASVMSSASTAATSTASSTRPQSRASLVHPASNTASFKARAVPATVKSRPSIEPRLSRAAALRMGVPLPDSPARSSQSSPTKQAAAAAGNVGISGVAKRPVAPPVSLKAPSIAPRLNKAALARQGCPPSEPGHGRPASAAGHVFPSAAASSEATDTVQQRQRKQVDFSNTPGHKRLSLAGQSSIASIAPPAIAPRQNRASMSRIQHGPGGGSSLVAAAASSNAGRSSGPPPSAFKSVGAGHARASSVTSPTSTSGGEKEGDRPRKPVDFGHTPGHKRASLSLSIPSLAAPSVAPRQNRASLARTRPISTTASPDTLTKPLHDLKAIPSRAPSSTSSSGKQSSESMSRGAAPDFSRTPGHKRTSLGALSSTLASLRAPAIAPRLNKAADARIGAGGKHNTSTGSNKV